jgi:two-component system sensor histidine kinase/response regulator
MKDILVIEDDKLMRQFVAEILASAGYAVIEAADANAGVELGRRRLPQLVLCDVMMSGMDGYGAVTALRAEPALAAVPIILMTAFADVSCMRKGMASGADDFLAKPFSADSLLSAVECQRRKRAAWKQQAERAITDLRMNINMAFPHELNTPLNGILGCAELLKSGAESMKPEEVLEMANCISESARRLHSLTEHFLAFAHLELIAHDPAEQKRVSAARVERPRIIISRVAKAMSVQFSREKDLQLEIKDSAAVAISGEYLNRVVEELVSNAFKFSKAGTPVKITGASSAKAFSLSVLDYGRGMTSVQIGNVGAYAQFDRKIHAHEGLGLGLIIAKRIAAIHAGSLRIESLPGASTFVEVSLPLVPTNQGAPR